MTNWMYCCGLAVARFCLAAWIGAAVLFVIVGVREVTTPEFSSEVKDQLVLLRFPAFYLFGAVLIGTTIFGAIVASVPSTGGVRMALALLGLIVALMAIDYQLIYTPLAAMITPPGQARSSEFVTLHHRSMAINTVELVLCLVAAMGLFAADPKNSSTPAG